MQGTKRLFFLHNKLWGEKNFFKKKVICTFSRRIFLAPVSWWQVIELSDHKVPIGVDLMIMVEMVVLSQTLLVVILKFYLALYTHLRLIAY